MKSTIMRNKHLTLYLAVGILTLLLSPVMSGQGDLPSEEIEVVKAFNARIIEARKVAFQPEAVPMDTTGRSYVYNVSAEVPPIEYVEPSIKPLALQTVRIPDNYDGFARVGYGMPNAWLGDLQYEFIRNEDMHIGVDLSHTSANNKDIANQRFMDNDADLWGTWYASELIAVKGNVRSNNVLGCEKDCDRLGSGWGTSKGSGNATRPERRHVRHAPLSV